MSKRLKNIKINNLKLEKKNSKTQLDCNTKPAQLRQP